MIPSVGIIGAGFVGGAHAEGFKHYTDCKVYDVDPRRSVDDYFDVIDQDIIFVCLPTPMKQDGTVDTSIIENALDILRGSLAGEQWKCVILKSTVPPADLVRLAQEFAPDLHLIYSPEFLTERTANLDFQQSNRLIFGDNWRDVQAPYNEVDAKQYNVSMIDVLYTKRFPQVPQIWVDIKEASLIKYFTNVFFATKISIMNEFALIAEAYGLDPMQVIGHVLLDQRIGRSHFQVPGHDGKRGFGGHCFPKDINGYMHIAADVGVQPLMSQAAWVTNNTVREERDWEHDKGRAVSKDFEEKK